MSYYIFLAFAFCLTMFSCTGSEESIGSKYSSHTLAGGPAAKSLNMDTSEVGEINFYFENSSSMNGYLNGENFILAMHRIIGEVKKNTNDDKRFTYFVNTAEHKVDNLLSKIDTKKIAFGKVSSSDHKFIFTNAIENAKENSLSIVVTDGIYSVDGSKPSIVAVDIELAFESALSENEIETVILKLSSSFDGFYYAETCDPGSQAIYIKQNRPYYVVLFGNANTINASLEDIAKVEELPGFKEKARFFITKDTNVNYTILTSGEELHSDRVEPIDQFKKGEVTSIHGERYSRGLFKSTPPDENYLGFGIAIDYSEYKLPESYLTNLNNYIIDEVTGYEVVNVISIPDLKKTTSTYRALEKLDIIYTHVIEVRASKDLYGDLEISLLNKLPDWIKNTGTENDCEIIGNEDQTFAFDQLINGISKAYESVNHDDKYLTIKLNVQP